MDNRTHPLNFSRRQFLSMGGAAAAAALVPAPMMSMTNFVTAGRTHTALLLPDFTLAPQVSDVFLTALTASLDGRFGIQHLSTGSGLTTQVTEAARASLAGGAKIIAAYVNDYDADDLFALTEAAGAGLLVINHGENMPRTEFSSPRFARASLHQWVEHYQHGLEVAGRGERVVMLTSFYESGFDSAYAFRKGVEDGGGGVLKQFVIRDVAELKAAMQTIAGLSIDTVYAAFNGADADVFLSAWTLSVSVSSLGVSDMAGQFSRLGDVTAAALNRWDGAKFAPDLTVLPNNVLAVAARYAQTAKTGWIHPYMTL